MLLAEVAVVVLLLAVQPIHVVIHREWLKDIPWQAIATFLAAMVALVSILVARRQTQAHFEARQNAEQQRFEREALDRQFRDILDRLSAERQFMRANAAIRLAEFAEQTMPGQSSSDYPFFARATAQLVAALLLEPDDAVQNEVVKAIGRLARFTSARQHLLRELLGQLADANRSSALRFMEALAAFLSPGEITPEQIETATHITRFDGWDVKARAIVEDIIDSDRFKRVRARVVATVAPNDEERPVQLNATAQRLIRLRDTLAGALKKMTPSDDLEPLHLEYCFLSGADLMTVDLSRAHLLRSFLAGSYLNNAVLRDADLEEAHLQYTGKFNIDFRGADLSGADLRNAQFVQCRFDGARLFRIQHGDGTDQVNLTGSNWWDADLSNPFVKFRGGRIPTLDIDETVDALTTVQQDLQAWLQKNFPRPA
jgi:hypothetical protein